MIVANRNSYPKVSVATLVTFPPLHHPLLRLFIPERSHARLVTPGSKKKRKKKTRPVTAGLTVQRYENRSDHERMVP